MIYDINNTAFNLDRSAQPVGFGSLPDSVWADIVAYGSPAIAGQMRIASQEMRAIIDGFDEPVLDKINTSCNNAISLHKVDGKTLPITNDILIRREYASRPDIPTYLQTILSKDQDYLVRLNLAGNMNLDSDDAMRSLVKDSESRVREALAANTRVKALDIQEVQAKDNCLVEWALAKNPNLTSPSLQLKMVRAGDGATHCSLMENVSVTLGTQREIIKVGHRNTRWRLAESWNLKPELQWVLAKDPDVYVRGELARRDDLVEGVQKILADDEAPYVLEGLAKNVNLTSALAQKKLYNNAQYAHKIHPFLAANPNLISQLQENIAKSGGLWEQRKLAANKGLESLAVQTMLAVSKDSLVRQQLAANTNLLEHVQSLLCRDEDCNVIWNLTRNPRLTKKYQACLRPITIQPHETWIWRGLTGIDAPRENTEPNANQEQTALICYQP